MYHKKIGTDWNFTNLIHKKLVEPLFLKNFDMILTQADYQLDRKHSIDYIANKENKKYSFQERIRRSSRYTDNSPEFTLRFKRALSKSNDQKQSELFKIKAQFLFYAILNKEEIDFQRYCIINIKNLLKAIENQEILIDENEANQQNKAYLKQNKPTCIIKNNHEIGTNNSSFIIFNLNHIKDLIDKNKPKNERIILIEKGYQIEQKIDKKNTSQRHFKRPR